jgi:hypothetical protein
MDFHVVPVIPEMPSNFQKQKKITTAGNEYGASLQGKKLIIDKLLYGVKTSAARFH